MIVSSPSGAGKTTLTRRLLTEFAALEFSVSYTTRAIRAGEGGRRPIIIAVTGENNRDACLAAGMDDFLAKPVRPPTLRATLSRWLERDRNRTGSSPPTTGTARSAG